MKHHVAELVVLCVPVVSGAIGLDIVRHLAAGGGVGHAVVSVWKWCWTGSGAVNSEVVVGSGQR